MIKIRIFNMKNFLNVVDGCYGAVNIIYPDGKKENINKQSELQLKLLERYHDNKNSLPLSLDIPTPKDYFNIVIFSINDY